MKIGFVTTWFPAGGGYVAKAYKDALVKDHAVFIYARGGKTMRGDSFWDGKNVTWAPYHYNGINIKHLLKWTRKNSIDILFFNEQRYWKPVIEAKKTGICIGSYIDYYTQSTVKAFAVYDFLICNTKRHYSVFKWHKNCHYIPWGTDINKIKPIAKKNNTVTTFLISAGWQGAYGGDRRGTLLGIDAFKKVKGYCRLLIYSQVKLEECLPIWQQKIRRDPRIKFIYGTFDPFPFTKGDVYLYPSKLDGIGLSLPEALSSGLPAITTNCAPMNEFVINDLNGTLVKIEKFLGRADGYYWPESICDLNSLTSAMQKYVDNYGIIESQSRAARKFAETNLDWNTNAQNLAKIFTESVNRKTLLDKNLIAYMSKLDNLDVPSLTYKVLSIFKMLFNIFKKTFTKIFILIICFF